MNSILKPVKPKLISDQVFDQLRELIFRGTIKPGEKLLPERELAQKMNVSRVTVRTAIQRLIDMGLVTHRQGKGTFARDYNDELKNPLAKALEFQSISLEKLLEIRLPLECNAAALAAKRADEADIKAITHSFEEMIFENKQGRLGSQADSSFHMAIAYASKNPLHIMIIRNFYDYIFYGIKETLESVYTKPENFQKIMDQHDKVLTAIKKRSAQQASDAMKAHIMFLVNFITNQ
ncbi:MAG: FadR family transcriptional regulator [Desulfobacterales bacterium]|nr:FadR family transcriptional regulator [Desulfobacterales bacterium]